MDALIYCRVSLDRAEGRSVREQEQEARRVCEREGWTVTKVVTDSVGASRHSKGKRAGWGEVRATLDEGDIDVLVTWEASRAQRDLMAYAQLRDLCAANGVLWSYSGRTHDLSDSHDRFTTGLDALLAEREADQIAERVQRAVRANAAAGRPHGRRLFGYRRIYDPGSGRLLGQEIDATEAAIVRRIFDDSHAGIGIDAIARALNAEGSLTPTGVAWGFQSVARVLHNPGYAARRVHRGEVVGPADWPPIIDPQRFDEVQALLEARQVRRSPITARMLTGVARCGVCQSRRVGVIGGPNHERIYVCRDNHCIGRNAAKLEDYVGHLIIARVEQIDHLGPASEEHGESAELQAQIDELETRWDALVDQAAKGDVSMRFLVRVEQTINADLDALRARLRRLTIPQHLDLPTGDVANWWDDLAPEQRRSCVGALIETLVIHRTGRGRRAFDPSKVEVVWR